MEQIGHGLFLTVFAVVDEDSILSIARVQSPLYFEHQGPIPDFSRKKGPVLRALVDDRCPRHERVRIGHVPRLWKQTGVWKPAENSGENLISSLVVTR